MADGFTRRDPVESARTDGNGARNNNNSREARLRTPPTDFPTLPFRTEWILADAPSPLAPELSVLNLVLLLNKEWQGGKSDSQNNFFFVGSPSHMASRMSYRGLLNALIALASGSSLTPGAFAVGADAVSGCRF